MVKTEPDVKPKEKEIVKLNLTSSSKKMLRNLTSMRKKRLLWYWE